MKVKNRVRPVYLEERRRLVNTEAVSVGNVLSAVKSFKIDPEKIPDSVLVFGMTMSGESKHFHS